MEVHREFIFLLRDFVLHLIFQIRDLGFNFMIALRKVCHIDWVMRVRCAEVNGRSPDAEGVL